MEGVLTSVSGTSWTVLATEIGTNEGVTFDSWRISLTGVVGAVGPTGATGATGATPTAPLTLALTTTNETDPLTIQSKNGHGGTGFAGITTWTNTQTGATNPNKFWRMTSNGTLEIINSAYNANIFSLTDAGVLNIAGAQLDNLAWTSYTPTLRTESGSFSIGNGTIAAAHKTIGKTCFFRMKITVGSTTSIGAGGMVFGLPVTAASSTYQFAGSMLDAGNAWYQVTGNGDYIGSTTEFVCIVYSGTGKSSQGVSNNIPFNFLSGDYISISGSYEVA